MALVSGVWASQKRTCSKGRANRGVHTTPGWYGGMTSVGLGGVCCCSLRFCILGSHSSPLSFSCGFNGTTRFHVADGVADEPRHVEGVQAMWRVRNGSGLDVGASVLGVVWMLAMAMSMHRSGHKGD